MESKALMNGQSKACQLLLLIGFVLVGCDRSDAEQGRLEIVATDSRTFQIVGPDLFVSSVLDMPRPRFGCGVTVYWGDEELTDFAQLKNCSELLGHTYNEAGNYNVSARVWRPGPDDGGVTTWIGTALIKVE